MYQRILYEDFRRRYGNRYTVPVSKSVDKRETVSPLKAKPLRNPGQSVQDEMDKNVEVFEQVFIVLLLLVIMTGLSLYNWLMQVPAYTMFLTSSIGSVGYAIYALPRLVRRVRRHRVLRQSRDGKRAVAEYLDGLRDDGFRVLHDVVGDGIYLDHVLVGPQGVYAIETETIEKPVRGDADVRYDGLTLEVAGETLGDDVVARVAAKAAWLERFILESTEISVRVRPVLVFPGWEVVQPDDGAALSTPSDVWVIAPKTLDKMLPDQPSVLKKSQIVSLSNVLKQQISGV